MGLLSIISMFTKSILSLFILFVYFCFATNNLHMCEDGTLCNDNDSCTGTLTTPDMCENGICYPGAPVCSLYAKPTTVLNEISGELLVTNDDKWEYLVWNSESEFAANKVY